MDQIKDKPLFVIDDDPVVDWPVIVTLPAHGGIFVQHQFTVSMKVLSPDEYDALFAAAPANIKTDDAEIKISEIVRKNVPLFQSVITGWSGVKDRAGNDVAYTPGVLAEQVTGKYGIAISSGLWRAISEIRYGARLDDGTQKDGARLGN